MTLQKEEVSEVMYININELNNLIKQNQFLPPHIKFYKELLKYFKK